METYLEFLRSKIVLASETGFTLPPEEINPALKPHQRDAVVWALRGGRRALFESFGLGKTVQELEFCHQAVRHEGGKALIVLPLGVRQEFTRDAVELLHYAAPEYITSMAEADSAAGDILMTNYERVRDGDIDPTRFTAVALDEASVLRSFGSKTYQMFLPKFQGVKYKLVSTATPSPNRYKELIHYAGYLEIMDTGQALTRFFQRDSTKANNLTLYPHKEDEFWLWVSSWALFIGKPSDLGYDDTGYALPPLDVRTHIVRGRYGEDADRDGQFKLMHDAAVSLAEASREKRESIDARVAAAKEIVDSDPEAHFILWHDLEAERHAICKALPDTVDIYGSMDYAEREKRVIDFSEGRCRLFATKKSLSGSGCNFQRHCHRAIFVGIDYEFNDFIQAVHRIYRFLQTEQVVIDIIYTAAEDPIYRVLMEKWKQHEYLQGKMREIVQKYGLSGFAQTERMARSIGVERVEVKGKNYTLVNNDCVEETARMAENSVDMILTSIPFSNHYEYTPSYNDFGHNEDTRRFFEQMDYLSPNLLRVLKPGRVFCCHVKDRVLFGNATGMGMPTMEPFHAMCIRHYMQHGFAYFGMITVVTDVVRENNQTYRLGWTEQCKDGSKMGVGCPEYILLFRKLPTDRSKAYADEPVHKTKEEYTRAQWQIDAHGYWRSSGDRLVTKEEIMAMDTGKIQAAYRKYSRGTVYEQGVDRKSFTDIQRTSVKLAEAITQAVNGEVHLYSTTQDAEGKRTIDQKDVAALLGSAENAPNGFYDHKTGNIYVDINAGNNGEGTILYTLGHEYTHLIHQNARESFDKLAEYLFSRYGEQGVDVDALVLAKREVLGVDYETAYEEVVADSMEAMLTDTNAAEKIAALKKTDKTLWEKLKDLVGKLLESVRGLYQNMTPNSEEGRKVQQMADALDKLSDLFVEGLGNVQTVAATDEGVSQQARDYSYAALTAKPDMQVTTVDDTANYAASSEARKNIIARAIAAAKTVGSTNENGNAVIHVDDTDTDVILSAKGLRHGLDRRLSTNAPVTLKAGEILKNAVRINELTPKKDTVDASYVLIGAAKNTKNEPYIVQFVVNRASNEVTSVDVLYSIGTKKEPAALLPEVTGVPATLTGSTISISSLLDYVNRYFPDILPESVLKHYGYTARPDGELGESALFQKRGTSDREILTTTAEDSVKNERERELLAEYKDKVGRLEGYEARLSANRAELTGLSLADGKKNAKRIAQLKDEIIKDTNRVEIVESQLKELEGRRGLQDLLGREKDAIRVQQETRMQELEEKLAEYREKYGVFPGGEKAARDIQLPKKSSEDEKISQTVRTILEAKATPEEMVPDIETLALEGKYSYEVYSDKAAIADASRTIKRVGWAQALTDWKSAMKAGNVSKKNTAMGWALYNNAANSGDTETALDVLSDMVQHQRSAAQALQATRILKQLSPETQLYQAQRSIANLQTQLNEEYGDDKAPKLKIDQTLAEQFMKAADQAERDAVLANIYRDIGKQMPSRFKDKWNAWRYLAMLGNVRTHVRNVVGNAGFVPVVAAKNVVATGIEKAVYRLSGGKMQRSKEFVTGKGGKALLEAAAQDYAKVADIAMGGGKYSDLANANKYIEGGRVIFKIVKPFEAARKANSRALDKEDAWFSKPHYAYAMAQYCKANGITAEMIAKGGDKVVKAREYAIKEAQKATYRDTNAFSQAISELGRMGRNSKNGAKRTISTVMEGILPFRKTPANILARGVEYSPIGLLNGFKQAIFDVQKGTKTAAEAIDAISAGLTGTGLLALGLFWAAQGVVRGHGDDDDKENDFMELAGHQAYALELPNGTSVTLDWLAPECLPFFVGVNLWELTDGGDKPATMADWLTAISQVSEPMLEMSCLQSLNDVFDSVGYASSNGLPGLPTALVNAAASYVSQGIPTILGQAERTGEGLRYTTFTSKNSKLTNNVQYALGRASAKIPIWDYSQIPYIDAWGRTESTGDVGTRAFNNFLNPAYTSTVDMSAMEEELLRLYEVTGENVFPSRAKKYFNADNQEINLTGEQYVTYAQKKGGEAYKWLTELTQSAAYRNMSNEEKVECIDYIYKAANEVAKAEVVSSYEPTKWVKEAMSGAGVANTAIAKTAMSGMTGEDYNGDGKSDAYSKIDKQLAYINGLNLTAAQKRAMAIAFDIKEKTIDTRAPW